MTMEKKIKNELMKMSAIMLVLVGLGIYAHDFVLAGLQAKLALNSSIFIIAGLAAWICFRHVLSLKNEQLALKALQVDCGNIRRRPVNPYRHPAVVFKEPELLGEGYRMITDEFAKTRDIKISNATVQMLLHDVDQRINDRKSTIMYFSGLMVFLGLLGAFMGLMKTVHSVSELIGAMDMTGAAGSDGIAKMIEGMKAPLAGMSVGFSSSLFGLMTSMVLGALERCMTSAMKALRNEFEHWLSDLADLEGKGGAGTPTEVHVQVDGDFGQVKQALDASTRQLDALRATVADTAKHSVDTREAMAAMALSVQKLSDSVANMQDPKPLLQPISDVVAELAKNQIAMLSHFRGLYDRAEVDRAEIGAILGALAATVDRANTLNGPRLHKQLDNLSVAVAESGRAQLAASQAVKRPGFFARLFGDRHSGIRREVRRMLLGQRRAMSQLGDGIVNQLAKMEAGHDEDRKLLAHLLTQSEDQQARLALMAGEPISGSSIADESGLTGARMEMDVLRRRLDAEVGETPPEPPQDGAAPNEPGKQVGGQA